MPSGLDVTPPFLCSITGIPGILRSTRGMSIGATAPWPDSAIPYRKNTQEVL